MTILHLAGIGPITKNFFSFLEDSLDCKQHKLLSQSKASDWSKLRTIKNISDPRRFFWITKLWLHGNRAEKIIIHGLWGLPTVLALALNPWLLKRCYWVIWGGDLYYYKQRKKSFRSDVLESLRKYIIPKIGHVVTYVEGDVNLARQWYGARGKYHECILYLSNVFSGFSVPEKTEEMVRIQVGNSADPSNNQLQIFDRLAPFKDRNIMIYAPLAYGDKLHADRVRDEGVKQFSEKFVSLDHLMPLDDYLEFLRKIDIAIFNHRRQQAMGNTIYLLGMGKKVYLHPEVTSWNVFEKIGVQVYSTENFSLDRISPEVMKKNCDSIKKNFSREVLISQWRAIFEE